jgi:hypothetical protein
MSEEEIRGTLLRGADGAVYFIPDSAMPAYRVPDEHAAEAREWTGGDVEAYGGTTSVTTSAVSRPQGQSIVLVGGVIAKQPLGLGPTAIPSRLGSTH